MPIGWKVWHLPKRSFRSNATITIFGNGMWDGWTQKTEIPLSCKRILWLAHIHTLLAMPLAGRACILLNMQNVVSR